MYRGRLIASEAKPYVISERSEAVCDNTLASEAKPYVIDVCMIYMLVIKFCTVFIESNLTSVYIYIYISYTSPMYIMQDFMTNMYIIQTSIVLSHTASLRLLIDRIVTHGFASLAISFF